MTGRNTKNSDTGTITIHVRESLLGRNPPTKGRIAALEEVQKKLALATELYHNRGDDGRIGTSKAIDAVYDYFVSLGIPRATLEPLVGVAAAILDAKRGVSSPVFEPDRKGPKAKKGRPNKPLRVTRLEVHMAAIMECCVMHQKQNGVRAFIEPAARQAARLINDSKWPVSTTHARLKKIREWVQQSPRSSIDGAAYFELTCSEVAKAYPLDYAKLMLKIQSIGSYSEKS